MNTFMSALSSGSHTPEGRPASFSTPHMGIQPQQGDADAVSDLEDLVQLLTKHSTISPHTFFSRIACYFTHAGE